MCENIDSCPFKGLKPKDIQIKDNRNRVENMTTSANAYSTMRAAGMNDTDALIVSRLVPDAQSVAKKNKAEQDEKTAKEIALARNTNNNGVNNNGSNSGNTDE